MRKVFSFGEKAPALGAKQEDRDGTFHFLARADYLSYGSARELVNFRLEASNNGETMTKKFVDSNSLIFWIREVLCFGDYELSKIESDLERVGMADVLDTRTRSELLQMGFVRASL